LNKNRRSFTYNFHEEHFNPSFRFDKRDPELSEELSAQSAKKTLKRSELTVSFQTKAVFIPEQEVVDARTKPP
jgi:hypothetical protein